MSPASDQENQNVTNFIRSCLEKCFDNASFAKFQQVLEYMGPDLYVPLYHGYNETLIIELKNLQLYSININMPEGFKIEQLLSLKIRFYSFRFIGNVGRLLLDKFKDPDEKAEENYLALCKIMLHHALTAKTDSANLALVELEQLSVNRNMTLQDLYREYKPKFLRLIIKAILQKLSNNSDNQMDVSNDNGSCDGFSASSRPSWLGKSNRVIVYMTRALEVFKVGTITSEDVTQSLIIITNLIHKEEFNESIKIFISHLASYQNIDLSTFIGSHIQAIVISLMLKRKLSIFDMTASVNKLCSFCDKTPSELLATKFTSIKGRLILEFSNDAKKVTDGFYFLSKYELEENEQPFEDEFDDERAFLEHLNPSLIGVLLGVDYHFTVNKKDLGSGESIGHLKGLCKLVSLLNAKQVGVIHVKLLSTLCLLLRLRPMRNNLDLNIAIVDIWRVFVSKLDEELRRSLLINICIALYDLVEDSPELVSGIYVSLLDKIDARTMSGKLRSLFFIPDSPAMSQVYSYLTSYVTRNNSVSTLHDFQKAIDCALPLIKFENQKCRLIGLTKIKQLLQNNQELLISNMLIGLDEPIPQVISKTIEALLALSSMQDKECSAIIAESLGIIGAINPIRLDHLIYGELPGKKSTSVVDLASPAFLAPLIEKLKNSLFSDQRSESESANYALQVLVKNFSVFKLCDGLLSAEALKALEFCKNTSYKGSRKVQTDFSVSVYEKFKSDNQYSYSEWLDKFALNIISVIKEKNIQEMLYACSYIFKYNLKLGEYLLPYAIIHIIINQPAQVDMIRQEFKAIYNEDVGVSTQDLDTLNNYDDRSTIQTLHFRCANMMFCALDAIHRLECDSKGSKSTTNLASKQQVAIRDFLKFIPKDKLATLSSKCRSHARALYYFEQFFSQNQDSFDRWASALQTTFVNLDDTYEAAGVEAARMASTTLMDDIANHEAFGRYDKAFICCNTALEALETENGREGLIEEALKCLSNQGDYHRLYEKSRQLIDDYASCKRNILRYAIEATWKLGKWDELNGTFNLTKKAGSNKIDSLLESGSVSQGYLLASIDFGKQEMNQKLDKVRYNLMKPLSIAMLDRSAYFRGYQNLLVLHSIEDFNRYLDIVQTDQSDVNDLNENTIDEKRKELSTKFKALFNDWDRRNKLVQPSLRSLEPLLAWQRSICQRSISKYPFMKDVINVDIGERWITSADSAREARSFDRAFFCLTQAQRWFGSELDKLNLNLRVRYHTEQAKLAWDQGEQTKAIRNLNLSLERLKNSQLSQHLDDRWDKNRNVNKKTGDIFPDLNELEPCRECARVPSLERDSYAKLKMLLIHYNEEAAAALPDKLFYMYEDCVHLGMNQEETYLRLARYYDRLRAYYMENPSLCNGPTDDGKSLGDTQFFSQTLLAGDRDDLYTKLMEHSIIAFGKSLRYGVRYVRESMPRLLNIWYDLGSKMMNRPPGSYNRTTSSRIESTIRFIEGLRNTLPPYYFMTAISLLLSRVTHSHSGVSKKTCDILESLVVKYPHQLTWQMVAMLNDKEHENRRKAGVRILTSCKKKDPALDKIIQGTLDFSMVIKDLCNKLSPLDKDNKAPKSRARQGPFVKIGDVSSYATKFDFTKYKIMVPNQSSISAIIPLGNTSQGLKDHNPYPEQNISYIEGFLQEVRIFNSLQKPKQVTLRCDDGKLVNLLCKAGDDLRKDNRCIEFLNLLNRILKRNNQSNERFFEIQTFLVLPMTSVLGIIEMVPNCESLKNLMEPLYVERNPNFHWLQQQKTTKTLSPADLHSVYMNTLLPKTKPPVFPIWFLRKFTEPTAWYMARLAYTRTTGVISMGGYIIGLGDRHLDNILIDTCNGRIVHVDFNLLFHQGETLPCPELVPFRLTHNIVDSFGSLGIEGNFRKVCEITMGVMRKEKDALLTTLKPFVHDPCSDWIKSIHKRTSGNASILDPEERYAENKQAKHKIEVVEKKLKGFPRSKKLKPLTLIDSYSVEAQVDTLIQEAIDTHNLAQMYHGWCPHI